MAGATAHVEQRIYRFAGCELDLAARELRRDGVAVTVQPKVFDLVAYLVEHRDRAVDKAEIQDALWRGVIVTEMSLTQAVRKARVALGDDANRQAVIRTVHGHGYRFVASLEDPPPAADPTTAERMEQSDVVAGVVLPAPTASREVRTALRAQRWLLRAAALAIALAVLLGMWRFSVPAEPPRPRLAVLPTENLSAEAGLEWTSVGLMGFAGALLESAGAVAVVPNEDVIRATAVPISPGDRAAALARLSRSNGATHMLHTRLERRAGLLRMSYSLLGGDGSVHEGTSVGGDATALMHGVVQAVVARLGGRKRLPREQTLVSGDAFVNEAFARGMALAIEGRCAEARQLFAAAISEAPTLFAPRLESASCARILGQWKEAEELFGALLAEQEALPPSRALARALLGLGVVYNRTGRLDEAGTHYERSLEVATAVGDRELEARALVNLAIHAKSRSEYDRSIAYLERAREAYLADGREVLPGGVYSGLANASMEKGALDDADAWLARALASFRFVGDRRNEAMMLNNLGYLRKLQGRLEEAEALHLESAAIREEIGDPVGIGRVHNMLAVVYNERGKFTEAISSGTIALRSAEAASDSLFIATAHAQLGDANLGLGRLEAAAGHYARAESLFEEIGDRQRRLEAQLKSAEIAVAQARSDEARWIAERVLEEARSAGLAPLEIQALLLSGDIAAGDAPGRAAQYYEQALELARATGQQGDLIRASVALAGLRLDQGDLPAAEPLLDFLATQPESGPALKLLARRAWARGDPAAAAATMLRARELSGARWTEADERLLHAYRG